MPISAKTLASRLARACRASLKAYASFHAASDIRFLGDGAYQFYLVGESKRERSGYTQSWAKAYVTVYPNHDVNVEYDRHFPEELFDALRARVTPSFTKALEEQ